MRSMVASILVTVLLVGSVMGCGGVVVNALTPTQFPNAVIGVDGQAISLDEIREISTDNSLTEEEKRQAFDDLGIEDPDLVEALLTLQ